MTVWFTADTDFGHTNVLALSRRPFADIQAYDEALIAAWNARVVGAPPMRPLGFIAQDACFALIDVRTKLIWIYSITGIFTLIYERFCGKVRLEALPEPSFRRGSG